MHCKHFFLSYKRLPGQHVLLQGECCDANAGNFPNIVFSFFSSQTKPAALCKFLAAETCLVLYPPLFSLIYQSSRSGQSNSSAPPSMKISFTATGRILSDKNVNQPSLVQQSKKKRICISHRESSAFRRAKHGLNIALVQPVAKSCFKPRRKTLQPRLMQSGRLI